MYTINDLERIEKAILNGTKRVRYSDGKEVEYQSPTEMLLVKREIENQLRGTIRQKISISYPTFDRG